MHPNLDQAQDDGLRVFNTLEEAIEAMRQRELPEGSFCIVGLLRPKAEEHNGEVTVQSPSGDETVIGL